MSNYLKSDKLKFKRKNYASIDYFFFEADFLATAFFFAAIIYGSILLEFLTLM
jgi:hypothetical protein